MAKRNFQRIGEYLQKARRHVGLTQTDVAQTLGCEQQFVSNWERGISTPPLRSLKQLAKLYKVSLVEIHELLMEVSFARLQEQIEAELQTGTTFTLQRLPTKGRLER